jgi:hypothetical protein
MPWRHSEIFPPKRHISSLIRQLEDASIETSICPIAAELCVCGVQRGFWGVTDNLLAPDVQQPIRAPEARRSVTSLPSGRSLASKFSQPIRALELLGKERPLYEEGTIGVSEKV